MTGRASGPASLGQRSELLDTRLIRLMIATDGKIARRGVLASAVLAAQLADLVLAGRLTDQDGKPRSTGGGTRVPPHLHELCSQIESATPRDWVRWFWRQSADPAQRLKTVLALMNDDGVLQRRRDVLRRPVVGLHRPELAHGELQRLLATRAQPPRNSHDAVLLVLFSICVARKWIPLDPPLDADYLGEAPGLDSRETQALRALVDALLEDRYVAASADSAPVIGGK